MNGKLINLIFSALFWLVMLLSSGKLKELLEKKKKVESLSANSIEFISTENAQILRFSIQNDTNSEVTYNMEGILYAKQGENLIPIPQKENAIYTGASYYIEPGGFRQYEIRLTDFYDPIPCGSYRYCKTVGCLNVEVDFEYLQKKKRR